VDNQASRGGGRLEPELLDHLSNESAAMSKTLDAIRMLPYVSAVDDEREDGSSIIVTLEGKFEFCSEDPGCGVKGFDTVAAARAGTARREVQLSAPAGAK